MPPFPENPEDFITVKFAQPGVGEMAEQLQALGALAEDPGLFTAPT